MSKDAYCADAVPIAASDVVPAWLSWVGVLGVGTLVGSLISGLVLFKLENKKQAREDNRLVVSLQRQDDRQWDNERRDAFGKVQALLQELRTCRRISLASTKSLRYGGDSEKHQIRMFSGYERVQRIQSDLVTVIGSIRLISTDGTFEAFRDASHAADDSYDEFRFDSDGGLSYVEDKMIDINGVESQLLEVVRQSIKTPDTI